MPAISARAALLVSGLTVVSVAPAPATAEAPIVVTVFDDPAPDGSCGGGGDCSLREAILLANATSGPGSVVQLAAGTYQLTLGAAGNEDTASGDLDAFQAITVQGAGADQTVIDVVVADRAFDAHGVPLTLVDLAVSGGGQVDQGGAVRAAGATLDLTRVALRGNVAERGGAVYGRVGQEVTLTDTLVEGNVAFDGGGMSIVGANSTLEISGGVLRDNSTSGHGGAIESDAAASVTITGAEVSGNEAEFGGGLFASNPDAPANTTAVTLIDTVFSENEATTASYSAGGGMYLARSTLDATRVILDGNRASDVAGGMELAAVDATITDSHLVANEAGGGGGAIRAYMLSQSPLGAIRIQGTLLERNVATVGGALSTNTNPLELTTTTVSGNEAQSIGGVRSTGPLTLTSSTLAANRSLGDTAANLYTEAAVTLTGSLLAQPGGDAQPDDVNCVVAGAGSVTGTGNVVDDASCALGESNRLDVDAAIEPLRANAGRLATHALRAESAAIDAAGATCPAVDGRGLPRPVDGNQDGTAKCDAGAYEYEPQADLNLTLSDSPDPVPAGDVLTYTATVFNGGPQDAVGTRVVVTLPAGLGELGIRADQGTCAVADTTVTCELGTLASGADTAVRISGHPSQDGQISAQAVVSSRAADPSAGNASAATSTTVGAGGDGGLTVISGDGVIPTAIAVSQRRFADPAAAPGRPAGVVVSRDDVFADSLGGSVLTGASPLLFTGSAALDPRTRGEIDRLLGGSGPVTLLGGENALSPAVAQALSDAGYTVTRLAGPSRVETAIEIARAAAPQGPAQVALARADAPPDNPTASWADAVSAGGYAAEADTPVLLTQTAALAPAVAAYLDEVDPDGVVLLGGEAALSAAVAEAVPGARRIQGPNRYATAGAIATDLWPQPTSGYLVTAGNHLDGWAYALAGAGLAADTNSPILLVETAQLPPETRGLSCRGGTLQPMTVIGGDPVVSPTVRDALGQPC